MEINGLFSKGDLAQIGSSKYKTQLQAKYWQNICTDRTQPSKMAKINKWSKECEPNMKNKYMLNSATNVPHFFTALLSNNLLFCWFMYQTFKHTVCGQFVF